MPLWILLGAAFLGVIGTSDPYLGMFIVFLVAAGFMVAGLAIKLTMG